MKSVLKQSGQGLNEILNQSKLYAALLSLGKECVPVKMASHLQGVTFEQQTLIFQLDDNLWSTQLRFLTPQILAAYQLRFPNLPLQSLKAQILPREQREVIKPVAMAKPNLKDAQEMLKIAQKVQSKALQKALQKLGSRGLEGSN